MMTAEQLIAANKAKNDWLPATLGHKGVIEIRNYRNPLEITPHVAITIDFDTMDNWRDYIVIDPALLRPAEVDLLIGDPKKAREKLGWEPELSFEGLVNLMVDADLEMEAQG